MPSGYAHYRFGNQIISSMPADIRSLVLRHRALFDVGLHGADFLFFHNFFKKTPIFHLGSLYHEKSGKDFFTAFCAHAQQHSTEGSFAYLYGVLAHYCLDTACHPFVYAMTDSTGLEHAALETEFDRYLMSLDGIKKPHETNISRHLWLKKDEYPTVAGFFPEVSTKDVTLCIRSMALSQQLLTIPTPLGYGAVVAFTNLAGGNTKGRVMTIGPDPAYEHLNGTMLELYQQALAKFPALLEQLNHHMAYGTPLGDDFKANFNRG